MIVHRMAQRSPEWFAVRLGKITGTSFATMANGTAAGIETLCRKVASERLTGRSCESPFTNEAMERGIALEDDARRAYETSEFVHIEQVGFMELDDYIGVSPDGLVGDDGGVEIKCPGQDMHLAYTGSEKEQWKHKWQILGPLWISGRKWWDFVSYCPIYPMRQIFINRMMPGKAEFGKLEAGAIYCRSRIDELVKGFADAHLPG